MHRKSDVIVLLRNLDLGSSVAELDNLLEISRVETSALSDLLNDKVDLVPGTKGSGKSALFRIFVDFLPKVLLEHNKVVIAHGVERHGDSVFLAFKEQFEKLSEDDFVNFWCIYLVSLAHEQFIKGELYADYLKPASSEVESFRRACFKAKIPEIKARKSLSEILAWTLTILQSFKPKLTYKLPQNGGEIGLDLFGAARQPLEVSTDDAAASALPTYVVDIKDALELVLRKTGLSIWLMVDRLDEIFPRRSQTESRALRGLLRAMKIFASDIIRVKVFLRDDMLEHIVSLGEGFTALTHITARSADTLRWSEDQILTMIVKRIFANKVISQYLEVDNERLEANLSYRREAFYKVFPKTVHKGANQSSTLAWIYSHTRDGRGVVTPRDVIDLLTKAKQKQQDDFGADSSGETEWLIGPAAIQYGHSELSTRKRITYLEAEFPHLWEHIKKFSGGKTEYNSSALQRILGTEWEKIAENLVSIGLISKGARNKEPIYSFPFLYRKGLGLSQGRAS